MHVIAQALLMHDTNLDPLGSYRSFLLRGNSLTENSQNHIVGTANGTAVLLASPSSFNGSVLAWYFHSGYVQYSHPTGSFITGQTWTVEFTYTPITLGIGVSDGTNYNTLLGLGSTAGVSDRFLAIIQGVLSCSGTSIASGLTALGTSYQIMVSHTGTTLRAYVNGTRVYQNTTFSPSITSTKLLVGCLNTVLATNSWSYEGSVDEVRITDGLCLQTGASYTPPTARFPNP